MSDTLEIKDLLLERDFEKIKHQKDTLEIIMGKEYRYIKDIYDDRENIFLNRDAYNIIKDNIFAGSTAVKFWIVPGLRNPEDKQEFKDLLEGLEVYNKDILKELEQKILDQNIEIPIPYTCTNLEDDLYLVRVIAPSGNKKIDNGVRKTNEKQYKNVVCFINLKDKYIEVRCEAKLADKIIKAFTHNLKLPGITPINILGEFNNNIEKFKDSFDNAKFINIKSIPEFDSELTEIEINNLVRVLSSLDNYFINKDEESLVEELKNIDIEENETGFIPLLLAGLSNIGIATNKTDVRDITNQPIYKAIERYLNHQSGMIVVNENEIESYSMQVGIKTNSIVFKRDATNEKFMKKVRNKLLNIKEV